MLFCKSVFLFFLFLRVNSEEPHCSKYDFEEKLLEKMIRIEFQIEQMDSKIEEAVKAVEKIKADVNSALENGELENGDQKLEDYGKIIDAKIKDLDALKDEDVTPTVAFKAKLNSNIAAPAGLIFVFPTVLFNEGGAYNTGTGKFTAPVSGTYMFSMAFCVFNQNSLTAGIMVNGNKYTVASFYGDANHGCKTADTVAVLTAGQMVWVEALSGGSSGVIIDHYESYRWNTFSGALIHK